MLIAIFNDSKYSIYKSIYLLNRQNYLCLFYWLFDMKVSIMDIVNKNIICLIKVGFVINDRINLVKQIMKPLFFYHVIYLRYIKENCYITTNCIIMRINFIYLIKIYFPNQINIKFLNQKKFLIITGFNKLLLYKFVCLLQNILINIGYVINNSNMTYVYH